MFTMILKDVIFMNSTQFTRKAKDNTKLYFEAHFPKLKAEAVICIVHGLGDHSGLFKNLIDYYLNKNYSVVTIDLRGHGKSEGIRGHIPSYEAIMDDLDILFNEAKKLFSNIPIFFYGHSFGGNLVINYALREKPLLDGIIATAPWLSLTYDPSKAKLFMLKLLNSVYPKSSLALGVVDSSALSHNKNLQESYNSDPLVHNKITARLYLNAFNAGRWAIENASSLTIPLLLLHGTADSITSPKASEAFAKNSPKKLCDLKLLEGLYHSLHNEINYKEIYECVNIWIEEKIEGTNIIENAK